MRRVNLATFIREYKSKIPLRELCRIVGVKALDGRVISDTKTQVDIDSKGNVLAVHRDVAVPPPRPTEPEPTEPEPEPIKDSPPAEPPTPAKDVRSSTWGKPSRLRADTPDYAKINEPRAAPQLDPPVPRQYLDDDDDEDEEQESDEGEDEEE